MTVSKNIYLYLKSIQQYLTISYNIGQYYTISDNFHKIFDHICQYLSIFDIDNTCYAETFLLFLARAIGVAVGRRQAVDWQRRQWTAIFTIIFHSIFHFFSVATFSHGRSAHMKKLIYQKLIGAPNNLGFNPFPDPVGHFGTPCRCGVAGGERVPPAPLGWYLDRLFLDEKSYF